MAAAATEDQMLSSLPSSDDNNTCVNKDLKIGRSITFPSLVAPLALLASPSVKSNGSICRDFDVVTDGFTTLSRGLFLITSFTTVGVMVTAMSDLSSERCGRSQRLSLVISWM